MEHPAGQGIVAGAKSNRRSFDSAEVLSAQDGRRLSHKCSCTAKDIPQGLKPRDFCGHCGTTKVVPFQKVIYETSSRLTWFRWTLQA